MRNLMRLKAAGIRCPTPYVTRRLVGVMEFIGKDGDAAPCLKDASLSIDKLREGYREMINAMRTLYQKCKLVHGDLSEYNILYFEGHLYVIDVSQSVDVNHPCSFDFLRKDCLRVSDFFKKHGVDVMSTRELFDFIVTEDEDGIDLDTGRSDVKRFREPYFLRRILCCEDMGNDFSVTKLVFLAVHAVFLESGFVGFDSMSGLRVDLFDILKEEASMTFATSVSYTLPKILLLSDGDNDNFAESIVLNFQSLGHYVNVYGSLANKTSHDFRLLRKLNIDKIRYVPALGSFWGLNEMDSSIAYAEKVIFELWKFVKDGLALPLLIDLCEKTGLELPPCFIRLPAELKFRILELLPGEDIGRVACVSKEMNYLSSNNELWKEKYMNLFGDRRTRARFLPTTNWKARFACSWQNPIVGKKRGRN
ncbi:Serine/threonine-protein kinase Rio1 [Euphorbia peplus]|nr:Serine/threonine-protein kinase Rio1 [Euphorbia peplus]